MLRPFYQILAIFLSIIFYAENLSAQTVFFPQEPMLARIEKIAEAAKINGLFVTYESEFLKDFTASELITASSDIENWLHLSLKKTPLTYKKINPSRFVIVRKPDKQTLSGYLAGKVTDAYGTPLLGATVWVQHLQKGTMTGANGDYALALPIGNYTVQVGYMGFESVQIEHVGIFGKKTTDLSVALQESKIALNEIVVTKTQLQNTIAGALRTQRNTSCISTVLSSQEINHSSANSVRDALKLVSGIAVTENEGIIVRGAGGRWNKILLDGIPLSNYDPSYKLFSFDLLPLSMVDNIRILKSSTPDIPIGFGNAITEIVTKDIPEQNFVQLKTEFRFHALSTFNNQRGRKRGSLDFLGFDDGSREIPEKTKPLLPEHYRIYQQKTPPSLHYSATIGQAYTSDNHRFGLTLSLTYSNTQQQIIVNHTERGRWKNVGNYTGNYVQSRHSGHIYGYQTTIGGMLNAGWQWKNHRISFRNIFSRNFENNLTEIAQVLEDIPATKNNVSRQFFNYPTFLSLIQNKLEGQHSLKNVLLRWNASHTFVGRERKDAAFSEMYKPMRDDSLAYFLHRNPALKERYPASSGWYDNTERSFRMSVSGVFPFYLKNTKNNATIGYNGNFGNLRYAFREILHRYKNKMDIDNPNSLVFQEFEENECRKTSIRHFPFVMFEHRWLETLRLVWGVQGNYENIASNDARKWYFTPSVNFSYMPVSDINVRVSYQNSVIRPHLADYIPFPVYDTHLFGTSVNRPIDPSFVQSFDFRVEKYMGLTDVLYFGLFYRHIHRPIERSTFEYRPDERMYILQNSDRAFNYGVEAQLRKQLDFVGGSDFLANTQLSAACVFAHSSVHGRRMRLMSNENGKTEFVETPTLQTRPLSGQMPYQLNVGIHYADSKLFVNVLFNQNGRQLSLLGENAYAHEYRAPFNSLEASIGYRFPKSGVLLKFSGANLLNAQEIFYTNTPDDYVRDEYNFPTDNLLPRKTENYDKGRDPIIHQVKNGQTFSFSISRTF